ncbi:hypothetical protein KIN20_018193 [Parelaphostrongylus tenuis]|uniref:Secreted protein n=1 Tax=Parelaphostrongylus tenuis TaxID=148309 RepID=A0AAD5MJJ5_PARTN|nr:hypothetical protein KIN20_018193 [Parelaphostrongylus tenuis]
MKSLAILFSLLATVAVVLACGVLPQGQAMTRNFTVSGFKLPTAMVFTASATAAAQLPGGIAATSDAAKLFVSRLVMQTVTDVLEQQGRSAGLPDAIISGILNQLMVQVNYDPLECKAVTINPAMKFKRGNDLPHCVVIGSTVTILCGGMTMNDECELGKPANFEAISTNHMSISGTFTTSNIIMANWSKEMWQSVINRAVRMLAAGPLAPQFFSAVGVVG